MKNVNNCVSCDTAWVLKGAGFPQPEPYVGMKLYAVGHLRYVSGVSGVSGIAGEGGVEVSMYDTLGHVPLSKGHLASLCAFAPSAVDIMSAMPFAILTKFSDNGWECAIPGHSCSGEDPNEACAELWLEVYGSEKTTVNAK